MESVDTRFSGASLPGFGPSGFGEGDFTAAVPRRRRFETAIDAEACARGYEDYPLCLGRSEAYMAGWYDAEKEQQLREDARRDVSMEDRDE